MSPLAPAQLPEPPRTVQGGPGAQIWFGRIFVLPHTLVGVGGIGVFLFFVLFSLLGTEQPGVASRAYTTRSKNSTSYHVAYDYRAGGEVKHGTDSVSFATYQEIEPTTHPGAVAADVRVKYFALGPIDHAQLIDEHGSPVPVPIFIFFWLLFWNTGVGAFLYQLWVVPYRTRQLYALGRATRGRIVSKRTRQAKGTIYYATYSFQTDEDQRLEVEQKVGRQADWEAITEGQTVTVLYWPEQPKRSVVYELGGYTVVPFLTTA